MNSVIIGMGEVGTSLYGVLSQAHKVTTKDLGKKVLPRRVDVLHVCTRWNSGFLSLVEHYASLTEPNIIDICSTVPPGTTEKLGSIACHSTTRGLHPNLKESLRTFTKHIGGPKAKELADYYAISGIKTQIHTRARTTELCHILSNSLYGVNILLADEMSKICRNYGVDYMDLIEYNRTSNEGYRALGHDSKMRMLLTPPNGPIGGHCVTQGAELLDKDKLTECSVIWRLRQ